MDWPLVGIEPSSFSQVIAAALTRVGFHLAISSIFRSGLCFYIT